MLAGLRTGPNNGHESRVSHCDDHANDWQTQLSAVSNRLEILAAKGVPSVKTRSLPTDGSAGPRIKLWSVEWKRHPKSDHPPTVVCVRASHPWSGSAIRGKSKSKSAIHDSPKEPRELIACPHGIHSCGSVHRPTLANTNTGGSDAGRTEHGR